MAAASLAVAAPAGAGMQREWSVDTHQLVRELAVLRRPQPAGDLNASLLRDANIRVRWVGALMRRVRVAGRDVYLVPAQSPVLGSGLVVFSPSGMACCVSAKALTEGGAFVDHGAPLWMLGVVPDGVARVTIMAHGRAFTARVTDNTVDVRSRFVNDAQEMNWYGPHGAVLKRLPALSDHARGEATTVTWPTIDLPSGISSATPPRMILAEARELCSGPASHGSAEVVRGREEAVPAALPAPAKTAAGS